MSETTGGGQHAAINSPHHDAFLRPYDLAGLKTYDLASRPSKVFHDDLGRPVAPAATIGEWLDSLPRQLAAAHTRPRQPRSAHDLPRH